MSRDTPSHAPRRAPTPALRESGGVNAALQLSPLPSLMVDEGGTVLACNDLFADEAGVPHTMLVGASGGRPSPRAAPTRQGRRNARSSPAATRAAPRCSRSIQADGAMAWLDVAWRRLTEPGTRRRLWIVAVTTWRRHAGDGPRTATVSQGEASAGEIAALAAREVDEATDDLAGDLARLGGTGGVALPPEGAQVLQQHVGRLRATVAGLWRFVVEHAGGPRVARAGDLVRGALDALPGDLRTRTVHVADESHAEIHYTGPDPQRVLVHVLTNALRHLPPAEPAAVRTYDEPGFVCIEVRDRGPGLRPEILAAASEPVFARAHGSPAAGLATARGLARALGGTLRLANDPNGGLVATLVLPVGEIAGPPRD